jgi:hypothetical protein
MKYLPRAGDNNEIRLLLSKIRYCYLLSQIRYLEDISILENPESEIRNPVSGFW